jgi:hypothetical protein
MNTAQLTPRAQAVIAASDEYTAPIFRAPSVGCSVTANTGRISMGAGNSTPQCSTCAHRAPDAQYPGWGWCAHPSNRVFVEGWPLGFTPSQSPSGTCRLHPAIATTAATGEAS